MENSVVVKKEIMLSEDNIRALNVYMYDYHGKYSLPSAIITEKGYEWHIDIGSKGEENDYFVNCTLYKEGNSTPIYKNETQIFDSSDLENIFMQDTKYKLNNSLSRGTDDDVELYFTFKLEGDKFSYYHHIKNMFNGLRYNLIDSVALFNYLNLDNDDNLFLCLVSLYFSFVELGIILKSDVSPEDIHYYSGYMLNKINFIKAKLEYFGYDEDYLNESKDYYYKLLENYISSGSCLTKNDILNCFMVIILNALINKDTNRILDDEKEEKLIYEYYQFDFLY